MLSTEIFPIVADIELPIPLDVPAKEVYNILSSIPG
jgi:hypothetical protein